MEPRNFAITVLVLAALAGGVWLLRPRTASVPSPVIPDQREPRARTEPRAQSEPGAAAQGASRGAREPRAPSQAHGAPTPPAVEAASAPEVRPRGGPEPAFEQHPEPDRVPPDDAELYAREPMSSVSHRVLKGWGAGPEARVAGLVGLYVVVDPDVSNEDLERLTRDIRYRHLDAVALNVRIVDSEEAVLFDRHLDGGALLDLHTVATVRRKS